MRSHWRLGLTGRWKKTSNSKKKEQELLLFLCLNSAKILDQCVHINHPAHVPGNLQAIKTKFVNRLEKKEEYSLNNGLSTSHK